MMHVRCGVLVCIALGACSGDAARSDVQAGRSPWEEARQRGVDFRAVGNEPGWHLEVRSGSQLQLVTDYGMRRITVPDPVAQVAGQTTVLRGTAGADELTVDITDGPCMDTMSGETFPSRVQVTLNGTVYRGCGRRLAASATSGRESRE